jgi:hypothetical protein
MDSSLIRDLKSAYFPHIDERIPTLADLIDACGENFFELTRYHDGWAAVSTSPTMESRGRTHEEAAGRLWLALRR